MIIRAANQKDNKALLDISRTEPMESSIVLYVDRSPDYFYLPGLQGYDSKVLVAERDKEIAGVIGISYRDARIFGKLQRIGYTGGLKIKESARGGRVLYRLMKAVIDEMLRMKVSLCLLTALKENQKILSVITGRLGIPPFYPIAKFRVFHIIPFWKVRCSGRYQIEELSPSDLEETASLFRSHFRHYELVEEFHQEKIEQMIEQSQDFSLDNFLVAKHKGRIVAAISYWDQIRFNKTIIQKYRRFFKGLYLVLKPLGILPEQGKPLKVLNIRHLFYDRKHPEAARDLLGHILMTFRTQYKLFRVGFHDQDPLLQTLKGIPRIRMDIILYAAFRKDDPVLTKKLQQTLIWEDMSLH
ncbi:MAG: GNAT family N-acetyltransferase [Candidatus Aminicenantes bacterium]|nr:GNAT family N-acetyltransferase [Candidatus Aminicenantes bacterium]